MMPREARLLLTMAALAFAAQPGAGAATEKGPGNMEIRTYGSSLDPSLKLTAEFHVPDEPRPLCLFFHGWHMNAAGSRREGYMTALAKHFFVVNVDMRGRGGSNGKPDASGHELVDGLDALDYARQTWPDRVSTNAGPYLVGGSGGGGNTLALAGKAPDLFAAAAEWAGMSDYALWYRDDTAGQYRDEMEAKGWIGGSPDTNPEGYLSRGGLNVLPNLRSPLLVVHGLKDTSVPPHHAQAYQQRAADLGKTNVDFHYSNAGHASEDFPRFIEFFARHPRPPGLPQKGTLLVHSFLACREFRVILDHPSRVGTAAYETSKDGALLSLAFSQVATNTPATNAVLRLGGDVKAVSLATPQGTRTVERCRRSDSGSDFRLDATAPWTVDVPR
jgi:pimeloyl-ACP methyl ester carboxylesterase